MAQICLFIVTDSHCMESALCAEGFRVRNKQNKIKDNTTVETYKVERSELKSYEARRVVCNARAAKEEIFEIEKSCENEK